MTTAASRSAWLTPLLLGLALGAAALAQEVRDPADPGPALLCVERKTAGPDRQGLYLRNGPGPCQRVWTGEPYDARALPDRTTLVVERWAGRVVRLDARGEVLFSRAGLDRPVDVEQAPDGTVVVVLNGSGEVVGLDPQTGAVRWRRGGFQNPFDVALLPEGGLAVADSGRGRVVVLDAAGVLRRSVDGLGFPSTVEALDGGHLLITTWSRGETLEVNAAGQVVWRAHVAGTVYRAVRRSDGTTLVIEGEAGRVHVLDAAGRTLRTETFTPGCVDYEPLDQV